MSRLCIAFACCAFFLLLSPALNGQQRDPLTAPEIDQLRDTAMDPDIRLKLYVTFARARLARLEQVRALRDDASAKKEEKDQYEFLLSNALETLDSSVQDHRQLLTEQEEAAKHKKTEKPARP